MSKNFVGLLWAACLSLPGETVFAAPLNLASRPVSLHTEDATITSVGALEFRGGIELRSRHPHFGGLSGMSIARDGARLSMVTDKGWWVTLQPIYDGRGWLTGVRNEGQIGRLLTPAGRPIIDNANGAGKRGGGGDGEAIARYRGGMLVSFEIDKKLYLYPPGSSGGNPLASRPRALTTPTELGRAPSNGAIEALTILKGGRIFALSERFAHGEHAVVGWVTQNRVWHRVTYQRSGKFFPTGAATLPNGDVLVLERRFNWLAGVASRIVRIPAAGVLPGALIRGKEIAVLDPPLTVENFEAIDVRVGPMGETLIYILSDDNFQSIQRNLLFMFRLKH
jgi:hypothetical protein